MKKNDILLLALVERQDAVKARIGQCATAEDPRDRSLMDYYIQEHATIASMIEEAKNNPKYTDEASAPVADAAKPDGGGQRD
jgi:hypothetical protein